VRSDPVLDHYECPQGEFLTLHTYDRDKLAIDKAPGSSCDECVLKPVCTPHDEGLPLAARIRTGGG
jgi:hypothetical protein